MTARAPTRVFPVLIVAVLLLAVVGSPAHADHLCTDEGTGGTAGVDCATRGHEPPPPPPPGNPDEGGGADPDSDGGAVVVPVGDGGDAVSFCDDIYPTDPGQYRNIVAYRTYEPVGDGGESEADVDGEVPDAYYERDRNCAGDVLDTRIVTLPEGPPAAGGGGGGGAAAPPPPDPLALRAEAAAAIEVSLPSPKFSPPGDHLVVHVPTWVWVDDWEPRSASASDRGVAVRVEARPVSMTWDTGEDSVVCDGPGVAWSEQAEAAHGHDDPACVATFVHASSTQSSGMYAGSVSVEWRWSWWLNGTLQDDAFHTYTATTSTEVKVGEIQALVKG